MATSESNKEKAALVAPKAAHKSTNFKSKNNNSSSGQQALSIQSIEANLLSGMKLSAIHYKETERGVFLAEISEYMDKFPVVARWKTIRQSHQSQTRTRAIFYYIPENFLRDRSSI